MGNFLTTGFRVSENREGSELTGYSEEKSKENDVNMESVNDSGPVEDYVMSEEGSSSLNTQQDQSRDGFEEENGFHVGDFVWVQGVNRHQWWPGKVYDSSDASDLALKQMQKGTLLVALSWKERFAWCTPSQLKPFLENFKEFSKTSDSTNFLSAVREAVREIGQHVENLLVCDEPLVSPVAVNCGIKKGVLVPDVRREIVTSLVLEKPGIVLEDVRSLAKKASFSDLLEIEVLKRKISAFYQSKGRFGLAKYDDENPYIIGLEDKEDASLKFNNSSCQRSLRKCSGLTRNKKRKHGDEVLADVTTTDSIGDLKKQVEVIRKRRKSGIDKREEWNHLEESEKKEESGIDIVVDLTTPLASLWKRVKVDDVSSSGETIVQRGKRERKKSKYLSPEYLTDFTWSRRKIKVESESAERMVKHSAEKDISFVRVGATTEEILDLVRAAALSTQCSQECKSSYDMIRGFVSIYRSFTYDHGAHKRNGNKKKEGENRKGVMEMEWLKKKLEEMRALLDETEGGEVTEELKMKLEEESRNLLDKVRDMTVGSSSSSS